MRCREENPTAVDDSKTVDLNSPPTTIKVLANDTDPDGGRMRIESASDPANGTVEPFGERYPATKLIYQPDPDYCNTRPESPTTPSPTP